MRKNKTNSLKEIQELKEDLLFTNCLLGTFYTWIARIENKIEKIEKKGKRGKENGICGNI